MASTPTTCLLRQMTRLSLAQNTLVTRNFARALATEAQSVESPGITTEIGDHSSPSNGLTTSASPAAPQELLYPLKHTPPENPFRQTAHCTTHSFPSLEPVGFASYPSTHLLMPLRRDILHRAVIFEGDNTRQGTASTKWRSEVHGSTRKIRPQKGTGGARLGDKKSPMLRGGGVAFGPKPRDFGTKLKRKDYDMAYRIALSYRYRRGQLIVLEDVHDIEDIAEGSRTRYLAELFQWNSLGKGDGRTLLVTNEVKPVLTEAFESATVQKQGLIAPFWEVDVKDLLKLGKIMIEKRALNRVLRNHESDMAPQDQLNAWWKRQKLVDTTPLEITSEAFV